MTNTPVKPGDRIEILASDWNDIIDMLRAYREGRLGTRVPLQAGGLMRVQNKHTAMLEANQVVRLSDVQVSPSDDQNFFRLQNVMDVAAPLADGLETIAVMQSPVDQDEIGYATTVGVVPALVAINDTDDTVCDVIASDVTKFSSGSGPFKIVYKPAGTGDLWCMVELQASGGGVVPAKVTTAIPAALGDGVFVSGGQAKLILDDAGTLAATADPVKNMYQAEIPVDTVIHIQNRIGRYELVTADCDPTP